MHKNGFTLAEVLLTLAIIGVVAALTIPAVITKVTQEQYVTGLKKAYNTLKAVEREAIQEHGEIQYLDWTGDSETTFVKYFKPHFDILKDCGATTDDGCFHGANEWKALSGEVRTSTLNDGTRYNFITSDGVAFTYIKTTNSYPARIATLIVDVNGKKGPNTIGRDIFEFSLYPTKGVKPDGVYSMSDENQSLTSSEVEGLTGYGCNTSCTGNQCGWYCTAKVLSEGSMNY